MISSPMEQILPIWILKLQVKSENTYSQSKKQNIIHSVRATCGGEQGLELVRPVKTVYLLSL